MPTIYQPGQYIDHYEIIRLLGHGGASRVYLARDRRSQQEVVLKFPLDYLPDPSLPGGRYRQALLISLLVFVVCLGLIAFGMLAQFAHHAVR